MGSARTRTVGACLLTGALLLGLAPAPARGAACCLSAGVFGIGRLVIWEEFAVGTSFSLSQAMGMWDERAGWRGFGESYDETFGVADVYGLFRLSERFQAFARVPWVFTVRGTGDSSEFGHGFGDLQAGMRFEAISIGEYLELPAVAITASIMAPTGRRPESVSTSLGTGTSGRGVWLFSLALSLEYAFLPWFVRADFGGSVSLPFTREDLGLVQTYGPALQLGLFFGRELVPDTWVLALGLVEEWELPYWLDGEATPDSAARSPTVSLSTSWQLNPHWMLQGSLLWNPPLDELGKNRFGRLGGTIGVRYGYF